jgi:predicted metal-binding membrane protein
MPASDPAANGADAFAWWRSSSALGRTRRNLLLLLVVLAGGAWVLTIYQSLSMGAPIGSALRGAASLKGMEGIEGMAMGGMSAAGWSFAGAAVFIGVWAVMMAAMMLPAAAPMILIFASAQTRHDHAAAIPTGIFIAGYLFVWSAIGAVVYGLVQIGAEAASYLGLLDRATWGPLALGATLVVAGLYQFAPLKRACLHHCRSPLAFVALHWRDGMLGAFQMGVWHGAYCLGCCWALFAVLVVAGIMSLTWMLALTLVVFAEKVFPHGHRVSAINGFTLLALGLMVGGSIL